MKHSTLSSVLIGMSLFIGATVCSASGSFSSAGGDNLSGMYNQGKVVVHKKIICNSCPLSSDTLDEKTANNIITEINADGSSLSELSQAEKQSALAYLGKRFGQ